MMVARNLSRKGAVSAYQSLCGQLLLLREVGDRMKASQHPLSARHLPCSSLTGSKFDTWPIRAGEAEASFSGGSSSAAVRLPRLSRTPVQHLRGDCLQLLLIGFAVHLHTLIHCMFHVSYALRPLIK